MLRYEAGETGDLDTAQLRTKAGPHRLTFRSMPIRRQRRRTHIGVDDRRHGVTFDLRNCGGNRYETHKGNRLRTRAMLLHVLPDAVFPHSSGVNVVFENGNFSAHARASFINLVFRNTKSGRTPPVNSGTST